MHGTIDIARGRARCALAKLHIRRLGAEADSQAFRGNYTRLALLKCLSAGESRPSRKASVKIQREWVEPILTSPPGETVLFRASVAENFKGSNRPDVSPCLERLIATL
jgi:hypothetical protein